MQEVNVHVQHNYAFMTKVIVIVVVSMILLSGVLVGVFLARRGEHGKKPTNHTQELCTTKNCLKQASRILRNMDKTVDPCTDFYNFTCGNFMRYAKIPQDQTRLLVVLENTYIVERELLQAYKSDPKHFIPPIREIKTFYRQCIASQHQEKKSIESVRNILLHLKWPALYGNWTEQYSETFNWLTLEAKLGNMGLTSVFLNAELKFDMKNFSSAYIGLDCTVPHLSKDLLTDRELLKEYENIIREFMTIAGKRNNKSEIDEMLNFFLKVERIKPTKFEMSDANFFQSFKTIDVSTLEKKLNISIVKFLNSILPSSIVVTNDTLLGTNTYQCLINMTSMLNRADKRRTANYMMWMAFQNLMWIINERMRNLDFQVNRIQTGVQAPLPLYKQCLHFIDDQLPELSSAMYLQVNYSENKRKKLITMVTLLIQDLMEAVNAAAWMDEATKHTAKEKVKKLSYVVSYSNSTVQDKYLRTTYKNLKMTTDVITNVRNIKRMAFVHMMKTMLWSAEKRNEATLLPLAHVVNAYYHPGLNAIAIPAGIAHGYIYSDKQEAYSNFGAIGIIIGHELSHVFDNVGRLYDANGKYVNWWSAQSNTKFIEKSQCFIKQYNNFSIGGKFKMNGTLTLGENMADLGGILLAHKAFLQWKKKYKIKKLPGLEKYTLEQMFWISVGNTWCDKIRPERLEMFLKTDVHSLGNFRVLGPLSNSKEFSEDFKCSSDSAMNRKQKCTIW